MDFIWQHAFSQLKVKEEEIHGDFKTFCLTVFEAVAKGWDKKESGDIEDSTILWPVEFTRCKTDFERVRLLMKLPGVRRFSLLPAARSKDCSNSLKKDGISVVCRDAGNEAWKAKKTDDALVLYTKALFFAETNEKLAFAYANRSCVLYRLGAYSETLQDIERAIAHGYPEDRRPRLLVRRGQALLAIKKIEAARTAFLEAQEAIQSNIFVVLSNELQDQVEQGLLKCTQASRRPRSDTDSIASSPLVIMQNDPPVFTRIRKRKSKKNKRPSSVSQNTPTQVASNDLAYKIAYGGFNTGWKLMASRDIQAGEVILMDKAYARRIGSHLALEHCYQCLKRCLNLMPCRKCSEVGFCSTACEEASWLSDRDGESSATSNNSAASEGVNHSCHKYECSQISRVNFYDCGGWRWLRSNEPSNDVSEFVRRYRTRLLVWSKEPDLRTLNTTWLPFACLARTDPKQLRALIQDTWSQSTGSERMQCNSPMLLAFSSQQHCPPVEHPNNDYLSVGRLSMMGGQGTPHKLWQLTVAAVFLAHCLSAGGYELDWGVNCLADPANTNSLSTDAPLPASWAAACLLHGLRSATLLGNDLVQVEYRSLCDFFGTPGLSSVTNGGIDLDKGNRFAVGRGIYPVQAMLPHSCNPNTLTVTLEDGSVAVFAMRPIKVGETLNRTFGVDYFGVNRTTRHLRLLQLYNFECECEACKEDWPVPMQHVTLRCPHCRRAISLKRRMLDFGVEQRPNCRCPLGVQQIVIHRYNRVESEVLEQLQWFSDHCRHTPFKNLSVMTLNKNIDKYLELHNGEEAETIMMPPSIILELIYRSLDTGLQLRYGCNFSICDLSSFAKTEEEKLGCPIS